MSFIVVGSEEQGERNFSHACTKVMVLTEDDGEKVFALAMPAWGKLWKLILVLRIVPTCVQEESVLSWQFYLIQGCLGGKCCWVRSAVHGLQQRNAHQEDWVSSKSLLPSDPLCICLLGYYCPGWCLWFWYQGNAGLIEWTEEVIPSAFWRICENLV